MFMDCTVTRRLLYLLLAQLGKRRSPFVDRARHQRWANEARVSLTCLEDLFMLTQPTYVVWITCKLDLYPCANTITYRYMKP